MERERFLERVAGRLGRARPRDAPKRPALDVPWPRVDGSIVDQFVAELERVDGTVSRATSMAELASQLNEAIAAAGDAPTVAVARRELARFGLDPSAAPLDRVSCPGDTSCRTPDRFRQTALRADLGVTTVTCAVASTGTLLLTATTDCPRSVSLLPRRHLALVQQEQIVADLGAALALGMPVAPSPAEMPSALVTITGPSRTSDIENDLSIGVHGPAEVHVIIYEGTP